MKFQKSVDLGGIYFAKVELTLKFDQNFFHCPGRPGYRIFRALSVVA